MFGIGTTELLVILVVALIVLGPKNLPKAARTMGKALGEFRRVSTDFQRTINVEMDLEEHEKRKAEAEADLFKDSKSAAQANAANAKKSDAKPDIAMAPDDDSASVKTASAESTTDSKKKA